MKDVKRYALSNGFMVELPDHGGYVVSWDFDRLSASWARLHESLQTILTQYVQLAGSGDCGDWNPEQEPEVIAARFALDEAAHI